MDIATSQTIGQYAGGWPTAEERHGTRIEKEVGENKSEEIYEASGFSLAA